MKDFDPLLYLTGSIGDKIEVSWLSTRGRTNTGYCPSFLNVRFWV